MGSINYNQYLITEYYNKAGKQPTVVALGEMAKECYQKTIGLMPHN